MPFTVDETYTREQIHAELGGEAVSYLPQKDGRIVCGCFSTDRNPEAPRVILVGGGEGTVPRKARSLAVQDGTIPVFLKRGPGQWAYDGLYRVAGSTADPQVVEEKQRASGRDDVVMVLFLEPAARTYLLTWNPDRSPWDDLEDLARLTVEGRSVVERWSCGRRRQINVGDRLFLLRQGVEPRGIIGSGIAVRTPYEAPHWDDRRREQGDVALRVDVRFDRLLNPELDEPLPLASLRSGRLAGVNWHTQISGIEIETGAAEELEQLWQAHLGLDEDAAEPSALEGDIRVALRRHRSRECWLREAKLAEYRRAHGDRLPCQVCQFDFLEVYGEVGRDYAQVHHLEPLGGRTRPSQTRLEDLAVLCANCHAMVHRGGVSRPLPGLVLGQKETP